MPQRQFVTILLSEYNQLRKQAYILDRVKEDLLSEGGRAFCEEVGGEYVDIAL